MGIVRPRTEGRPESCTCRSIVRASNRVERYLARVFEMPECLTTCMRAVLLMLIGAAALGAQQALSIPMGDPEGLPKTASRIERHGITWTFAAEHCVGTFANGDPWVLGPVEIVKIEPETFEKDGRVRNGSVIDPDPSTEAQGYDSSLYGEDTGSRYVARLNVAVGIDASQPLLLTPLHSLVSVESRASISAAPVLQKAAVLTCVATAPPPDAFRPPYAKGSKRIRFRLADLNTDSLQNLDPVGDLPLIESVAGQFERLWLDHVPAWVARYMHPVENMPDYGRDIAALVGSGALLLNLDLPRARKQKLLVGMVQFGMDNYAALSGGCRWKGVGGHGHGRKLPILIAGLVLQDDAMLNVGRDFVSKPKKLGGRGGWFAEDSQTFVVKETSSGVWNWGHGNYRAEHEGLPEWGFSHCDHPERDDASWDANPYRRCCTGNAWLGQALAARMMGLREHWQHEPFFDYVDRYQQVEHAEAWHRSWVKWHPIMWQAYRSNY